MEKVNVIVFGCNGYMGQLLCKEIAKSEDFVVVAGYDVECKGLYNFPIYTSINNLGQWEMINYTDLFIDFSAPKLTIQVLELATKHHIPTLIGTNGLSNKLVKKIKVASKQTSIFMSFDMSYAVKNIKNVPPNDNLFAIGALEAARYLLDCGCEGYFSMDDLLEDRRYD